MSDVVVGLPADGAVVKVMGCALLMLQVVAVAQHADSKCQDTMCCRYQFRGLISKFNCSEETAVSYVWSLNGTLLSMYTEEERNRHNISVNEEILSLRADTTTCVVCRMLDDGGKPYGNKNWTLIGLSSSEMDIKALNDCLAINISWSLLMNMSEVDTDILYSVSISNVTDEGHPTAISYDNCSNLTETYCVFSPDIPAPCREQKYNFTVIPSNGAGQGESSQSVIGSFDSAKAPTVTNIFRKDHPRILEIESTGESCLETVTVQLELTSNTTSCSNRSTSPVPLIGNVTHVSYDELQNHCLYDVTPHICGTICCFPKQGSFSLKPLIDKDTSNGNGAGVSAAVIVVAVIAVIVIAVIVRVVGVPCVIIIAIAVKRWRNSSKYESKKQRGVHTQCDDTPEGDESPKTTEVSKKAFKLLSEGKTNDEARVKNEGERPHSALEEAKPATTISPHSQPEQPNGCAADSPVIGESVDQHSTIVAVPEVRPQRSSEKPQHAHNRDPLKEGQQTPPPSPQPAIAVESEVSTTQTAVDIEGGENRPIDHV